MYLNFKQARQNGSKTTNHSKKISFKDSRWHGALRRKSMDDDSRDLREAAWDGRTYRRAAADCSMYGTIRKEHIVAQSEEAPAVACTPIQGSWFDFSGTGIELIQDVSGNEKTLTATSRCTCQILPKLPPRYSVEEECTASPAERLITKELCWFLLHYTEEPLSFPEGIHVCSSVNLFRFTSNFEFALLTHFSTHSYQSSREIRLNKSTESHLGFCNADTRMPMILMRFLCSEVAIYEIFVALLISVTSNVTDT